MEKEQLRAEIVKALQLDVSDKTEKKNGLTYLSWGWAIGEVMKLDAEFSYEVLENENGLPYFYDEKTGYIVKTRMTILGITRGMWLPVMDYKNQTMMNPKMFDINKTIMRCLVKNIAVCCGIGLYIYNGEDLPEQIEDVEKQAEKQEIKQKVVKSSSQEQKAENLTKVYVKKGNKKEIINPEQEKLDIEALEQLKDYIIATCESKGRDSNKMMQYYSKKYQKNFEELNENQLEEIRIEVSGLKDKNGENK